jgi:hypothetical protein
MPKPNRKHKTTIKLQPPHNSYGCSFFGKHRASPRCTTEQLHRAEPHAKQNTELQPHIRKSCIVKANTPLMRQYNSRPDYSHQAFGHENMRSQASGSRGGADSFALSLCAGLWVPCRIFWAWFGPALGPNPARYRRFPAGFFEVFRALLAQPRQCGLLALRA